MADNINHPPHYGGEDNPYEAIKVIEAWNLNFNLGNCVKYIARLGKKAQWYLDREVMKQRELCRTLN